jgi:hypothetical protein
VARVSDRRQIPAIYSQFFGTAYLAGTAPVNPTPAPRPSPQPAPQPAPPSGTFKIGDRGPGVVFFAQGGKYMEVSEKLSGEYTWFEAITAARNYKCGGYSDWRLPTKDELNLVYQNLRRNNLGNMGDSWHWSSSEGNGKFRVGSGFR